MILYTIIPDESIFNNNSFNSSNQASDNLATMEINYMGEKVEVFKNSSNKYVVGRVLSTSLSAYLNPKLQPGTEIE
ncbi:YlzJ-like family protein [Pseudobacteroides cellulosolvens]|uniref:YlzJ-like protein n=1 Tax=Pseudobacteroides cellulosolvens ATCC 35603 = DSM 2933 TaxID=398512 RepID=A0A0L6JLY1_9FIRM|nr:YlzJ-like family protein [Pseudobacteroides cellulosolvens]KNY26745.1 YlzJ-like protein [Pseudobacteroides cellulosolvens ATCC 35603 = DSM 2933]